MSSDSATAGQNVVRFGAHPRPPRSIIDTGLEEGFLIDLVLKMLYRLGIERVSDIARIIKLSPGIVDELLVIAQDLKLVETLGQRGASLAEAVS